MSDLHELSATEQVKGLRTREISSADLTRHYLDRITRLDPDLGAFVTVDGDAALQSAARADELLDQGADQGADQGGKQGVLPALTGLPLGIKDLAPTAGLRTTFGSAPFTDHVPAEDSWTVGLLRRAGAVFVGKTNTPEFGASCFTENDVTERPSVTPYATTHYSSGSSGGAATAVAAGLLPLAHASDSAGSIRTPASACHLVGIKPSRGLVSSAPASAFMAVGTEGPLARTVADAALLLDVMARPAPGDLYGWTSPSRFTDAAASGPGRRLRIAAWTDPGLAADPHPEAVAAVRRAVDLLRELGHDVREIPNPGVGDKLVRDALETWFATTVAHAATLMAPVGSRPQLRSYTRHLMDVCGQLSAQDVLTAHSVLAGHASSMLSVFEDIDVALTPATNGPPVPIGHFAQQGVENVSSLMLDWSCFTPWVNFTGQPAVAVPSHLDEAGLPHGVQLIGRPQHDAALVALAAELEAAASWQDIHPPPWYQ
ncbi:hypothetical protein ASE01_21380 [Nocardioides sp. Root190]|uniref:amidase n=1 Tax=Nocardioides sp. Root190 TaxID=1736488 RepID=UPI0006F2F8F0|nr:amidase [Nocardioides sp. Root190]KRB73296.1 hypothetical protein ASE01_21380 [Nocardioides sp. Root190]